MAIVLEKVRKSFGEKVVLDGIDKILADSSCTALMGASGIGKTTLLSILAGLQKPDAGAISGVPESIAMVFQEDRLIESEDAVTNLKLVCGKRYSEEELMRELEKIGIEDAKQKPVAEFSGGMKRRVAIARAVLAEAELVLLDEPFKGLDAVRKAQVIEYVRERVAGKTLLLVTHEAEEAQQLGAEIWRLEKNG